MSARVRAPRLVRRRLRAQNPEAAARISRELGLPPAASRVLAARGFVDVEAARTHLSPAPDALHDPFGMGGLPEAVERLAATAARGGRIVVFGDYDCDGIGAIAILTTALRKLGADARPFIPHRLHDGYGLKAPALRRALEEHAPEGIVTVDCGITAVETVAEATRRGVYVVVTDHHLPPAALPEGAVLVDPKLPGCRYPFKELCGAGIAWKLAEALFIHSGARVGVDPAARRRWLASLAKIAALSTVADMVPLTGENRVLVAWGLSGLADPRSPGLAALLKRSGVPAGRSPSTREVAFRIAPRLNATGRIDHAARALELLTTADAARAETLADEIEAANDERRAVQETPRRDRSRAPRDELRSRPRRRRRRGRPGLRGVAPRSPRNRSLARGAARRAARAPPLDGRGRRSRQRALVRPDAPVRTRRARRCALHEGVRRSRRRARAHDPRGLVGGLPGGPARGLRRGARRRGVGVRARGRHGGRRARGGRRSRAGARALRAARPGEPEAAAPPARTDVGRAAAACRRSRAAASRSSSAGRRLEAVGWTLAEIRRPTRARAAGTSPRTWRSTPSRAGPASRSSTSRRRTA